LSLHFFLSSSFHFGPSECFRDRYCPIRWGLVYFLFRVGFFLAVDPASSPRHFPIPAGQIIAAPFPRAHVGRGTRPVFLFRLLIRTPFSRKRRVRRPPPFYLPTAFANRISIRGPSLHLSLIVLSFVPSTLSRSLRERLPSLVSPHHAVMTRCISALISALYVPSEISKKNLCDVSAGALPTRG